MRRVIHYPPTKSLMARSDYWTPPWTDHSIPQSTDDIPLRNTVFLPDLLHNHSLPINLNNEHSQKTTLSFPGKICLAGKDLAISDTGNHRVLVVSKDGLVKHSFGGLEPGWHDSLSLHSKFNAPQGITFWNGCLYVADTENHVIRKVCLNNFRGFGKLQGSLYFF